MKYKICDLENNGAYLNDGKAFDTKEDARQFLIAMNFYSWESEWGKIEDTTLEWFLENGHLELEEIAEFDQLQEFPIIVITRAGVTEAGWADATNATDEQMKDLATMIEVELDGHLEFLHNMGGLAEIDIEWAKKHGLPVLEEE